MNIAKYLSKTTREVQQKIILVNEEALALLGNT